MFSANNLHTIDWQVLLAVFIIARLETLVCANLEHSYISSCATRLDKSVQ